MKALRLAVASLFVFILLPGLAGCGSGQSAVMPKVVGLKLDVALSDIKRAGFANEVEVLGGGMFGIIDKSNWVVCEQLPNAGEVVTSAPRLTVDRSCGEATDSPAAASEPADAPSQSSSEDADATPSTAPESTLSANQVEDFLKESYGMKKSKSWSSLCGLDKGFYPYPCAISKITLASGVLRIQVQDSITASEAETYAMYALNFLCASDDDVKRFSEITWVEISDTSGGVRGQQAAAENKMCQLNQ